MSLYNFAQGVMAGASGDQQYLIEQSLLFNDDDSAYLTWTPSGAGSRRLWTFSCWFKRGNLGLTDANLFSGGGSTDEDSIRIENDALDFIGDGGVYRLTTTQLIRDPGAWYHIVGSWDGNTGAMALYLNGVQITAFSTETHPPASTDSKLNQASVPMWIGSQNGPSQYWDGLIAEAIFIDGQVLTPSSFGEFNANGNWNPIDVSGLTFGTNGFYLPFTNSTTFGDDYKSKTEYTAPVNTYKIGQSLLFDGASRLYRTPGTTGDSDKICSIGAWVKLGDLTAATDRGLVTWGTDGNNYTRVEIYDGNPRASLVEGGATTWDVTWSPKLRDPGAWIHIAVTIDTTEATNTDRVKLWLNGQQITSTNSATWPALNETQDFGTTQLVEIGYIQTYGYFDGGVAELLIFDGIARTPSSFGRFDANGNWNPIDPSGLTFGTNGFWFDFADSADFGKDARWTLAADPNTTLLIHSNTTDASTTFTDSAKGKTITANGDVQHDTDQAKFGTTAIYFDGTGDYLTLADHADFELGSGAFTLAAWVRWNGTVGNASFIAKWDIIGNNRSYEFGYEHDGSQSGAGQAALVFVYSTDGTTGTRNWVRAEPWAPVADTWYHVAVVRSGTNHYLFVDGVELGTAVSASATYYDGTAVLQIAGTDGHLGTWAGWMDEILFVKGTAIWTSNFTVPTQAYDGVSWAASGLTTTDQLLDSPTNSAANGYGNLERWNPNVFEGPNFVGYTLGNKKAEYDADSGTLGNFLVTSGKYYIELEYTQASTGGSGQIIGVCNPNLIASTYLTGGSTTDTYVRGYSSFDGTKVSSVNTAYGSAFTGSPSTVRVQIFLDMDNGAIWFGVDDTIQNSATRSEIEAGTTTNAAFTDLLSALGEVTLIAHRNANNTFPNDFLEIIDEANWNYTAPAGFKAISTANLPAPTIADPTKYFVTSLYEGNAGQTSVRECYDSTGTAWTPDLVWIKNRDAADKHQLYDVLRGPNNALHTNTTVAANTQTENLKSFVSGGFTLGTTDEVNTAAESYVAWCFKAGGAGSSNMDGSITSTVSANQTAGFSIVSYTGTGANATIGHGLSQAPEFIIVKNTDTGTDNWAVGHEAYGWGGGGQLNLNNAFAVNALYWQSTAPTTSLFSVGTGADVNTLNQAYIAYCFHSVPGYCKVFSYFGNGDADGTFIPLDFRPNAVILKQSSAAGQDWEMHDSGRMPYNITPSGTLPSRLQPSTASAESTTHSIQFFSNGFKPVTTGTSTNGSSATYIGIAWADYPFKESRAR